MRIGIEIRSVSIGASGGIVPLLTGVLNSLIATHPEHQFFVFRTIFNRGVVDESRPNVATVLLPVFGPWAHLQETLDRERIDVLFRAYPTLDRLSYPLQKQVVLIPDLQHERFPEFFSRSALRERKLAFGKVLSSVAAIGTLSEFAKSTILAHPENRCNDVFLVPPSLRNDPAWGTASVDMRFAQRLEAIGPYFYYPANLWKHKNHLRVIRAYELFRSRTGSDVSFVLTGHSDGWDDIARNFRHLPLHHLGFVSGQNQRAIYKGALAMVFFSLYEGFGMPLLEAFSAACPVICSNTSSLPEVAGDAALFCNPTDVPAMADLMARIAKPSELRESLVAAGRKRLEHYSWEHSASELMTAIERVAGTRLSSARSAGPPGSPAQQVRAQIFLVLRRAYRLGRRVKRALARKMIEGLYLDYSLAAHATFETANVRRESRLFFSGHPVCDGSVAVIGGGKTVAEARFKAGESVSVEFPSPGHGAVELRFSSSMIDRQGREVSFRLDATNLLEDADL